MEIPFSSPFSFQFDASKKPETTSSSSFNFQFNVPKLEEPAKPRPIIREPSLASQVTVDNDNDAETSPFQRLPGEIHSLILSELPPRSDIRAILRLATSSRHLYTTIGPSNNRLWYHLLHLRTASLPYSDPIPTYDPDKSYHQEVVSILRSGSNRFCQRCLLDHSVIHPSKIPNFVASNLETKRTEIVRITTDDKLSGIWCWECADEAYVTVAIIQLETPIPSVPHSLRTTIWNVSRSIAQSGEFVPRTAIKKYVEKYYPRGYVSFNIPESESTDISEGKRNIVGTITSLYKREYQHCHFLLLPTDFERVLKDCFQLNSGTKTRARTRPKAHLKAHSKAQDANKPPEDKIMQNHIIDEVFGIARKYPDWKNMNTADRQEEVLSQCKNFLIHHFGSPPQLPVPLTAFLELLGTLYWRGKMKEMGKGVRITEQANRFNIDLDYGDRLQRGCGFCANKRIKGKEENEENTTEMYRPAQLVIHIYNEHPKNMDDDWPDFPDVEVPKQERWFDWDMPCRYELV